MAYCLKIVDLDPIRYDLLFERFLNPGRKQMPDIDMDFDERYRADVMRYAAEKYGSDRVAQVITFSTIKARAAVRDAARVLGKPYSVGDRIAKAMPPLVMGRDTPLHACITKTDGHEEGFAAAAELRAMRDDDPDAKEVIEVALGLEGLRRQDGIHAAAVVISRDPLTDYLPIQRKPGAGEDPEDAPIVTQYEMHGVEDLGLLKMDFLGLRNLSVMERALDLIEAETGTRPDIDAVDLADEPTLEMLRRAKSVGVFQLEGAAMRQTLSALAPTSFDDGRPWSPSTGRAPWRPTCTGTTPTEERAQGTHVPAPRHRAHPQGHLRAHALPGVGDAGRPEVRRVQPRGGRQPAQGVREEDPQAHRRRAREVRRRLRDRGLRRGAGHAALRHHRAVRRLRVQQVPLLRLRPRRLPDGLAEGALPGRVHVGPADVGQGQQGQDGGVPRRVPFHGDRRAGARREPLAGRVRAGPQRRGGSPRHHEAIVFGLAAVRNVGESLVERIVAERNANGPFADIFDFCARVDPVVLNKRTMESLVKGGAFDSLGHPRQGLCLVLEAIVDRSIERRREQDLGITTLFAAFEEEEAADPGWGGAKVAIPDTEFDKAQRLAFEKEMLGLYVSDHPLMGYEAALARHTDSTLSDMREDDTAVGDRSPVRSVGGVVTDLRRSYTKKGDLMARFVLEDLQAAMEVFVFPKTMAEYGAFIENDAILVVRGRLDTREEEPKIVCMEVSRPVLERGQEDLHITLPLGVLTDAKVDGLKDVLSGHPGQSPVLLHVGAKVLRLPPEFNVDCRNGLVGELKRLLGQSAVLS